jgi:catechol 2,3-dioxygenase-like lactoylglutathione lyase family enzyme
MIQRYSFVAITTEDLSAARRFWVEQLGFEVLEGRTAEFFIVDAGGLRLCVDRPDGELHVTGSTDPVIGLKVHSVEQTLAQLADRGMAQHDAIQSGARGRHVTIRDPDGRAVVLTEAD